MFSYDAPGYLADSYKLPAPFATAFNHHPTTHHPDCEIPLRCRLQRSRPWACLGANHRTLYWLQAAFESRCKRQAGYQTRV